MTQRHRTARAAERPLLPAARRSLDPRLIPFRDALADLLIDDVPRFAAIRERLRDRARGGSTTGYQP